MREKLKLKTKHKIIPIALTQIVAFSLIGVWTWYLLTLPKMEEQLKFSPFMQVGEWKCTEMDFVCNSKKVLIENKDGEPYERMEVSANLNLDGQDYDIEMSYVSTRGFSHKYAVSLRFCSTDYQINFTAKYSFRENEFILKGFSYNRGSKHLPFKELHFVKNLNSNKSYSLDK